MIPLSYNLRSMIARRVTTLATALGIALVVFVFASAQMLSAGVEETLGASGSDDIAIVLSRGSDAELSSNLDQPNVALITALPGVRARADQTPDAVGEIVGVLALDKIGTTGVSNVQVRGVTDRVLEFRPSAHIIEGRAATPGTDEAIVGRAIRGRFRGLEIGQTFDIRHDRPIRIVGVFDDDGSYASEVWADLDTVRTAFGREGLVSSVRVHLSSADAFDGFSSAVESDRRLGMQALRETTYYADQSQGTANFVRVLGFLIAFFFTIAGVIGAMITMYAAVANRTREIGTLRALGFPRLGILTSFVIESTILALAGGAIGALASTIWSAFEISMVNFASWSEIVFSFHPSAQILGSSMIFAAVVGVLGGFFPALSASRVSPIAAMRA